MDCEELYHRSNSPLSNELNKVLPTYTSQTSMIAVFPGKIRINFLLVTSYKVLEVEQFSLDITITSKNSTFLFQPGGYWEPSNEVASQSPAEHLVRFDPEIF